MVALICFVLTVLASPFKSNIRLEAENACCFWRERKTTMFRTIRSTIKQNGCPTLAPSQPACLSEPRTGRAKRVGLVLILAGVIGVVWSAGGTIGTQQNIGHVLFLGGALLWASYTVAMRRARLDGLHAAAIAVVVTLVLYLPVYAVFAGANLLKAPLADIALQAFVQGFLTAVISLVLYGRAVSILGASSGAAFPALCPAMTAVLAIPILGEWPAAIDWIAIILISAGVYVVSGGPLPGRRM